MSTKSVGFAGLGAMGFGMASNLLKSGFQVTGFDLNQTILKRFSDFGGLVASTVVDAAKDQKVFLVMVATPGQIDSVIFSETGLLKALPTGAILCLFSTVPPDYISGLPARLAEKRRADIRLLDCPVSGGAVGADAGTLSIMMAGDQATLDEVKPYLSTISAPGRLFFCGSLGAASRVKMLNQLLAGIHIVAAAEILSFAKSQGLSARETYRIAMSSCASSWILGDRGRTMLTGDWTPKSAVDIFTKDLGIVSKSAAQSSCQVPMATTALQMFVDRAASGHGRDDDASVVCNYEKSIDSRVCDEIVPDSLPTPPLETESKNSHRLGAIFIAPDLTDKLPTVLSSYSTALSTGVPLLAFVNERTGSDALESLLPPGSIVALISGLVPKVVEENVNVLQAKFSDFHSTDGHIIQSGDKFDQFQFLFSSESPDIAAAVTSILPEGVTAVPVTGPVGSATKMYLALRLGVLVHLAAAAECCCLAKAEHVSPQFVYNLIAGAAGSSDQFNQYFISMFEADYKMKSEAGLDSLSTALQDLHVIKTIAKESKFPTKLLDAAYGVFQGASRKVDARNSSVAAVSAYWT